MATKDANYYRLRASEIRGRGGNELLARQMENYADNLDAGIYNNSGAAWTPPASVQGAAPAPAKRSGSKKSQPSQQVAGGTRGVTANPSYEQPVAWGAPAFIMADPPFEGIPLTSIGLPQRTAYMDIPEQQPARRGVQPQQHTGLLKYLDDFSISNLAKGIPRQGYNNSVADFKRLNDTVSAPRQAHNTGNLLPQTYAYMDVPSDVAATLSPQIGSYMDIPAQREKQSSPQHTGLLGYLENFKLSDVAKGFGFGEGQNYNNNIADFKRLNDTGVGRLPQKEAYMDLPEYTLPEVVVERDRPKQFASKPGGGSNLTAFYAERLGDMGYEQNEGKDGIHYGNSGLVNRMRDLRGLIPYNESDGTNCARTVSVALDGTPYSNMYNVDQFIATAKGNGQLIDPASGYVPRAGDLAVTNNGNHIVMVTENGGVIQNGKTYNGVYETKKGPQTQKGGVQYYIRTSDYDGNYPSFHADLGMGGWYGGSDVFGY